jgi:hypothetical protein
MSEELGTGVTWNHRLEEYFASTGEKAHCLSILHKQAESIYDRRKVLIDIPVIVGSGVIAFLNAGSSAMFENETRISSIALGVGSLFVGVINTIGSYFQWSKRAEGHRIAAIQYSKLFRFLNVEMSLPRNERMTPKELLKWTKDQYDRLQEISPIIPRELIEKFKKDFDKPEYNHISRPEEANGLEQIIIYGTETAVTSPLPMPPAFRLNPLPNPIPPATTGTGEVESAS